MKLPYNAFVEAMRGFGWHKYLDCLRIFSLKWWRILAQASFEIVWQCFLGSDEEIRLRRVLKLSYNVFVEAVRNFGWNKFWKCLTMISLKWCRNPAKTCFEFVLQCFPWSDEGSRLRQLLRLSQIIFVEAMRKFGWNKFWNCLTMISLMWCRNPAKTCFEFVLECFHWSDEEIWLKHVLKLSDNDFVDVM